MKQNWTAITIITATAATAAKRQRRKKELKISRKVGSLIIAISHINALKLNGNANATAPHRIYRRKHRYIIIAIHISPYNIFYLKRREKKAWRAWTNRDYLTYDDAVSPTQLWTFHTKHIHRWILFLFISTFSLTLFSLALSVCSPVFFFLLLHSFILLCALLQT